MFTIRTAQESAIGQQSGFSILEAIIVLMLIIILTLLTVRFADPTLYYADQQASTVMDVLKEARQRALTQKETMRVEINADDRTVRIIEENDNADASDDAVLISKRLGNDSQVIFNSTPANVNSTPNEPTPVPVVRFEQSTHPLSLNQNVATFRFLKNGNVVNAGSNAIGDGAVVTGATIYFWTFDGENSQNPSASLVRAITVRGTSGSARTWKCPVVNGNCTEWTN